MARGNCPRKVLESQCTIHYYSTINTLKLAFGSESVPGDINKTDPIHSVLQYLRPTKLQTHLAADDPQVVVHHRQWRLKASEFYTQMDEQDLVFTAPLTIAEDDFSLVRKELLKVIRKVSKTVKDSPAERFAIFNIDWIRGPSPSSLNS